MTFALTVQPVAAFFLGVLSSLGLVLLVMFWRWIIREALGIIPIPIFATGAWLVVFAMLFHTAFGIDAPPPIETNTINEGEVE